nr:hypothetical protein [Providencia stuartii]
MIIWGVAYGGVSATLMTWMIVHSFTLSKLQVPYTFHFLMRVLH